MAKKKQSSAQHVDVTAAAAEVDSDHANLIAWVNEADDGTSVSRALSEKARDYYDGVQLEPSEIAKLKLRRQAPVVINRIKPKCDSLMGMEKAAKTTAKAYPRTPKHEEASEAATEGIRFCLQDNHFDQTRSSVWENILIEGTGGGEVVVKDVGGDMKIIVRPIMWDRLIYDPHSRRKDFSDARYLGQVVWMDYDEAVELYPDAKDVLEAMQGGSSTYDDKPRWMDNTRRRVKICELYYYRGPEVWYACFTYGGYCKAPAKSPYVNEEGQTEWPYEFASAFVDRDGGRYGAVRQLLDVQDEINKRRSKALHLMSVRQIRLERGAVEDVNKVRQELARPDGVVETTPGMEFEVLKTGDMAAAQFNLLTEAKMEIDAVGANAATQGKDTTVQSGRALIERRNAGQTEVGPLFDALRYWQLRIYRKLWNRIKQYWKAEKWIRVTDDEQNLRWVGLNRPMTALDMALEQAKKAGANPQQLAALQAQIAADPMSREIVQTQNDIAELDVDIILSEVPDVLTQQIEDFQVLGEMVKSGFPMPPAAVIEASPLANKDKILKMMREQPQIPPEMQKQMEQAQEQMKALAQENQALKQDQQAEAAKLQQKQQGMQAEFALKAKAQEEEARLAREKAEAEFALKKWVQEQELALQGAKVNAEKELGDQKMALERDTHQQESQARIDEKNKADSETAMPQFMQAMQTMIQTLAEAMQQQATMQAQMNAQLVQAISKPKVVKLGNIQRSEEGITSASATVN